MLRREAAADPALMAAALKGLREYQEAQRPAPMPLMPAIAEAHGAVLRDYGGTGRPLLFVPSLINPPNVLDLSREKSLLRWLAARGHRVLLLDWGVEAVARRDMSVGDHVEKILLPMIAALNEAPVLAGYCLGGTMAMAAAASAPVSGLILIAAPWHFDAYPHEARKLLAQLWNGAEPVGKAMGVFPMEVLQSAFWTLDPVRTVTKFAQFAALARDDPKRDAFVALEDWANDGPPLPSAAARELFEDFFGRDRTGSGGWQVAGRTIDPARLACPVLNVLSTSDHIVPRNSASRVGDTLAVIQGHVGMIVGSRATELREKLDTWTRTVAHM